MRKLIVLSELRGFVLCLIWNAQEDVIASMIDIYRVVQKAVPRFIFAITSVNLHRF